MYIYIYIYTYTNIHMEAKPVFVKHLHEQFPATLLEFMWLFRLLPSISKMLYTIYIAKKLPSISNHNNRVLHKPEDALHS